MAFPISVLEPATDEVELIGTDGLVIWTGGKPSGTGDRWADRWSLRYSETAAMALAAAVEKTRVERFIGKSAEQGGAVWWDVLLTPIIDDHGGARYVVATARNVTDYATIIQEREAVLEQERRARLEIEKENRRRDYALLVAAHELGGPLFAVRGWAQYLQLGNLEPQEIAEAIEAIARNTDRQQYLVERLLEVARFRARQASFTLVANRINEIIDDAIECVRAVAGAKHISLERKRIVAAWVMADFDQLQRAFSNLLINAIKFTPVGGAITVSSTLDQDRVTIEFIDTGIGMTPEFLEKAFEPFSQEAPAAQPALVGAGLGLSIVRRIVEGHHGSISVASRPGHGSVFVIDLPAFSEAKA